MLALAAAIPLSNLHWARCVTPGADVEEAVLYRRFVHRFCNVSITLGREGRRGAGSRAHNFRKLSSTRIQRHHFRLNSPSADGLKDFRHIIERESCSGGDPVGSEHRP